MHHKQNESAAKARIGTHARKWSTGTAHQMSMCAIDVGANPEQDFIEIGYRRMDISHIVAKFVEGAIIALCLQNQRPTITCEGMAWINKTSAWLVIAGIWKLKNLTHSLSETVVPHMRCDPTNQNSSGVNGLSVRPELATSIILSAIQLGCKGKAMCHLTFIPKFWDVSGSSTPLAFSNGHSRTESHRANVLNRMTHARYPHRACCTRHQPARAQ
eukprot:6486510-Amphidinium_carterae.2